MRGRQAEHRIGSHRPVDDDRRRCQQRGDGTAEPGDLAVTPESRHRGGGRAGGEQVVAHRVVEACQQVRDRLVGHGDAADRGGPGDDQHLVGVVGRVLRLPQRVRLVPAADVAVEHRHERHGLAGCPADVQEERGVRRVQTGRGDARETIDELVDRRAGIVDGTARRERGLDPTRLRGVQSRLGALQQRHEPLTVGPVEPDAVLVAPAASHRGQLDESAQQLLVGHRGDVAEPRLGGAGQRGDDLVVTPLDGVGITGDLVEQRGAARRRVVEEVDVGIQAGPTRGHAAADATASHTGAHAGCVDQRRLDPGRRRGLGGGHRRGPDEHAVDRHLDVAVAQRPATGQQLDGAFGGADATAGAKHDVVVGAQRSVPAQQQVVEVDPRVVAAGLPTLDVHHQQVLGCRGSDGRDLADLVVRAGFERVAPHAELGELVEQRDRGVGVGDARRDGDAADRRAVASGGLHQTAPSQVQAPQVRVEVQGVEHDLCAGVEQLGELLEPLGEDGLGHLPAARELRDEPGVGGRGDDRGVDGRGCHAGQHDRRAAGRPGEAVLDTGGAVGQRHQAGSEALVGRTSSVLDGARGDERTAVVVGRQGQHGGVESARRAGGQARDAVGGAEVEQPLRRPGPGGAGGQGDGGPVPVAGAHQHDLDQRLDQVVIGAHGPGAVGQDQCDAAGRAREHQVVPASGVDHRCRDLGEHRVVTGRADRERLPHERRGTRIRAHRRLQGGPGRVERRWGPRDDGARRTVAQRDARRAVGQVGREHLGETVESHTRDGDHRRRRVQVAAHGVREHRRRHGVRAGARQVSEQHRELEVRADRLVVVEPVGTRRDRGRSDDAAGVARRRHERTGLDRARQALFPCLPVGEQLGEQHAGQRDRQRAELAVVGSCACVVDPAQRIEAVAQRGEVRERRRRGELGDAVGPATCPVAQPGSPGEQRLEVVPPPPALTGERERGGRGACRQVVRERSLDRGPGHVRGRVEAGRQVGHRHLGFSIRDSSERPGEGARGVVTTPGRSGYRSVSSFRAVTASFRAVTNAL